MENLKLGILYICVGRYDFFWKSFYESSERYLMQGSPCIREYFVFTDASSYIKRRIDRFIGSINTIWDGLIIL